MPGEINKLYKYSSKFDYQQQYEAILEADIVSAPEQFTDNISLSPDKSDSDKNPSAIK